jgi:hypothetical protein
LEPDGLTEEDRFLLVCNFDELASINGEHQEYWLLTIQAAQETCQLSALADRPEWKYTFGTT